MEQKGHVPPNNLVGGNTYGNVPSMSKINFALLQIQNYPCSALPVNNGVEKVNSGIRCVKMKLEDSCANMVLVQSYGFAGMCNYENVSCTTVYFSIICLFTLCDVTALLVIVKH